VSPGIPEEAGQTARSALDVFREQPFMLAMVLINIALLGYLYYESVQAHQDRRREIELLYDNRKFVGDLLARCNLPTPPPIPDR